MQRQLLFSVILLALFSGCTSQHDIGTTHVAVVSATPWDEYAHQLQPTFQLTEQAALNEAVPVTSRFDQLIASAVSARLAVGAGDDGPATQPTLPTAAALSGATTMPSDRSALSAKTDALVAVDPFLKYQLATALLQEIRLINRYVNDALITGDVEPYIVRVQLTTVPSRRDTPVDQYFSVGFFNTYAGAPSRLEGNAQHRLLQAAGPDRDRAIRQPKIVPLLVTDQAESAIRAERLETLRQLALAMQLAFSQVQAGAGFDATYRRIEEQLARQYNSLLTVGRQADNVLRVRIGARQTGNNQFQSTPQNHFVTVLVLMPKDAVEMELVSQVDMINPKTNKWYTVRFRNTYNHSLMDSFSDQVADNWRDRFFDEVYFFSRLITFQASSAEDDIRLAVANAAAAGDFQRFVNELNRLYSFDSDLEDFVDAKPRPTPRIDRRISLDTARRLYVALGTNKIADNANHAKVKLAPPATQVADLIHSENCTLFDDGKTASATILVAQKAMGRPVRAYLDWDDKIKGLVPTKIEASPQDGTLKLTFPSLPASKADDSPANQAVIQPAGPTASTTSTSGKPPVLNAIEPVSKRKAEPRLYLYLANAVPTQEEILSGKRTKLVPYTLPVTHYSTKKEDDPTSLVVVSASDTLLIPPKATSETLIQVELILRHVGKPAGSFLATIEGPVVENARKDGDAGPLNRSPKNGNYFEFSFGPNLEDEKPPRPADIRLVFNVRSASLKPGRDVYWKIRSADGKISLPDRKIQIDQGPG